MTSIRREQLAKGVTLYLGDCRDVRPELVNIDAVVSDPPYGMAWNTDSTRFTGGHTRKGKGRADYGAIVEDNVPFDPQPWLNYNDVILWGSNHFAGRLPVGTTLVYLKKSPLTFGKFLSDAEIGWQKGGHGVYCKYVEFQNNTARKTENNGLEAAHPTQRPLDLMRWCIERLKGGRHILDPYMGSGTTGIAAVRLGRHFTGVEIEPKYFDVACRRIETALKQPDFFVDRPPPPKQETLL